MNPARFIAHRGQVIDKKMKAAIDLLKDKAVVSQLQALQVKQQAAVGQLQQLVANDKVSGTQAQEHVLWIVGALAAVVLILAMVTWQLARRKPDISFARPSCRRRVGMATTRARRRTAHRKTSNRRPHGFADAFIAMAVAHAHAAIAFATPDVAGFTGQCRL